MTNWTIEVASEKKRVAALRDWNNAAGRAAAHYNAASASVKDGENLLTVSYGESYASISPKGEIVRHGDVLSVYREDGDELRERINLIAYGNSCHPAILENGVPPGAIPLNKIANGVRIPCGVVLIIAAGGVGKTPLAHALASHGVQRYSVARIGEPMAGYARTADESAVALIRAMAAAPDVVVDSIKDLLSGGGAAMKSGLSRSALVTISGWASLACETGRTLYVPVNPSTPDPEVLELLAEISRSNATMTIVGKDAGVWTYSARTGEGLERTNGKLTTRFSSSGDDTSKSMTFGHANDVITPEKFDEEFSRIVRRSSIDVSLWTRAQRRAMSAE